MVVASQGCFEDDEDAAGGIVGLKITPDFVPAMNNGDTPLPDDVPEGSEGTVEPCADSDPDEDAAPDSCWYSCGKVPIWRDFVPPMVDGRALLPRTRSKAPAR
jgi:hypothetical protein